MDDPRIVAEAEERVAAHIRAFAETHGCRPRCIYIPFDLFFLLVHSARLSGRDNPSEEDDDVATATWFFDGIELSFSSSGDPAILYSPRAV